ncbi:MAG: hypothetical protein C0511_15950 [Hyphomicrobium sp.]|nr:hypothetical protein [Hyphomicrobium sp.]
MRRVTSGVAGSLLRAPCALAIATICGCSSPSARFQDAPTLSQGSPRPIVAAPAAGFGRPYGVGGTASPPAPSSNGPYQWNGSPNRIAAGGSAGSAVSAAPPPPVAAAAIVYSAPSNSAPRGTPAIGPQAAAGQHLPRGSIEVKPGDTLYGLSRQHGVSISALMDANQLKSLALQPGQILKLPATSRTRS